jgi:transposase
MHDKNLYTQILNLRKPWEVTEVLLNKEGKEIIVKVGLTKEAVGICPKCGKVCPVYDHKLKRWRHLDTCQYQTIIEANLMRVQCAEHGVLMMSVPWAEDRTKYTALFEALIIDWLKEASISAVAEQFKLSWSAIDGIMQRAVNRGILKRKQLELTHIGIDETSFQKKHEYVTVVTDGAEPKVLYVAEGRKTECLDNFFESLTNEQKEQIKIVSMDMWEAYIKAVKKHIPDADMKIAFDKFHIAKYLCDAVNKVRKKEHWILMKEGREDLKGTKYKWLTNPLNMSDEKWEEFSALRNSNLKTAKAWSMKETAMQIWEYVRRGSIYRNLVEWISWVMHSKIEPMKKVALMFRRHMWGIINAIITKADNGHAESINSKIQKIKRQSCGFRNRERFRNAIYFHLGNLDLYPERISFWS